MIHPNLNTTSDLSYILGVCLGDGSVFSDNYTRGHYRLKHYLVSLRSTERSFVERFASSLRKIDLHPWVSQRGYVNRSNLTSKAKPLFVGKAHSRVFHDWFKSLSLKDIEQVATNFPIEFIRGFYESEGSYDSYTRKLKNKSYPQPRIRIYNSLIELLQMAERLLQTLNIKSHINGPYISPLGTSMYVLTIGTKGGVQSFLALIRPCIKNSLRSQD